MKAHIPLTHANAISRHSLCNQQVIIALAPDAMDTFCNLTELELITQASLTKEAIPQTELPAPTDFCFIGAKKLALGVIILDLNLDEAAN